MSFLQDGKEEGLDLDADPGETRSVWSQRPDVVARLLDSLDHIRGVDGPLEASQ